MAGQDNSDEEYLDDPIQLINLEQKRVAEALKKYNSSNIGTVFECTDSDGDLYIEKNNDGPQKNIVQQKSNVPQNNNLQQKSIVLQKANDQQNNNLLPQKSDVQQKSNEPQKRLQFSKNISISLPVNFFVIPQNVELIKKCIPLSIKVVNCNQHPWYYKKHVNYNISDTDKEVELLMQEKVKGANTYNNEDAMIENEKVKIRPVASPYRNLKINISKCNAVSKKECSKKDVTQKVMTQNDMQVNFKKNQGLIGMKITLSDEINLKSEKKTTAKKKIVNVEKDKLEFKEVNDKNKDEVTGTNTSVCNLKDDAKNGNVVEKKSKVTGVLCNVNLSNVQSLKLKMVQNNAKDALKNNMDTEERHKKSSSDSKIKRLEISNQKRHNPILNAVDNVKLEPEKTNLCKVQGLKITVEKVNKKEWAVITPENSSNNDEAKNRNKEVMKSLVSEAVKITKDNKNNCTKSEQSTFDMATPKKSDVLHMKLYKKRNITNKSSSSKTMKEPKNSKKHKPDIKKNSCQISEKSKAIKLISNQIFKTAGIATAKTYNNISLKKIDASNYQLNPGVKYTEKLNQGTVDYFGPNVGKGQSSSYYIEEYAKIMQPNQQRPINKSTSQDVNKSVHSVDSTEKNTPQNIQNVSMCVTQQIQPTNNNIISTKKNPSISDTFTRVCNNVTITQNFPTDINLSANVTNSTNLSKSLGSTSVQSDLSTGICTSKDTSINKNQSIPFLDNNLVSTPRPSNLPLSIPLKLKGCSNISNFGESQRRINIAANEASNFSANTTNHVAENVNNNNKTYIQPDSQSVTTPMTQNNIIDKNISKNLEMNTNQMFIHMPLSIPLKQKGCSNISNSGESQKCMNIDADGASNLSANTTNHVAENVNNKNDTYIQPDSQSVTKPMAQNNLIDKNTSKDLEININEKFIHMPLSIPLKQKGCSNISNSGEASNLSANTTNHVAENVNNKNYTYIQPDSQSVTKLMVQNNFIDKNISKDLEINTNQMFSQMPPTSTPFSQPQQISNNYLIQDHPIQTLISNRENVSNQMPPASHLKYTAYNSQSFSHMFSAQQISQQMTLKTSLKPNSFGQDVPHQQTQQNSQQTVQPIEKPNVQAVNILKSSNPCNPLYQVIQPQVLPPTCDIMHQTNPRLCDVQNSVMKVQNIANQPKKKLTSNVRPIILRNCVSKPRTGQQQIPCYFNADMRQFLHPMVSSQRFRLPNSGMNVPYNVQHYDQGFHQTFFSPNGSQIPPQNLHQTYNGSNNNMNPVNGTPFKMQNYWNGFCTTPSMLPPPPPPPPLHSYSDEPLSQNPNQTMPSYNQTNYAPSITNSVVGKTIIGCNDRGLVRKINISVESISTADKERNGPVQPQLVETAKCMSDNNQTLKCASNVVNMHKQTEKGENSYNETKKDIGGNDLNKKEKSARKSAVSKNDKRENDQTVNSKREMMKELCKITTIESSNLSPLKRPLPNNDSIQEKLHSPHIIKKPKPGPLCKKPKLNSTVITKKIETSPLTHKGYSPPILPIPTFQKSLEILARSNICESVSYKHGGEIEGIGELIEKFTDKRQLLDDKSAKKISIDEYKKRSTKPEDMKELISKEGDLLINNIKMEIKSETPEQDQGYDSDSTMR